MRAAADTTPRNGTAAGSSTPSLSRRLTRTMLVLAIAPLVATAALSYLQYRNDIAAAERTLGEDSLSFARLGANLVDIVLGDTRLLLNRVARESAFEQPTDLRLTEYASNRAEIDSLIVTNAAGLVVASSTGATGISVADRPRFQRVLAGEELVYSDVVNSLVSGKRAVAVAIPYRNEGRFAGMVSATLSLEALQGRLNTKLDTGLQRYTYVTDRRGALVVHPDASLVRSGAELADNPPVAAALRGESGWMSFTSAASSERRIGGYTTVRGAGWPVVSTQPPGARLLPFAGNLRNSLLLLIVTGVVATLLARLLGARLAAPLAGLARTMQATVVRPHAAGETLEITPASVPRDTEEYRVLAESYNALSAALSERFREGAALTARVRAQNDQLAGQAEELRRQNERLLELMRRNEASEGRRVLLDIVGMIVGQQRPQEVLETLAREAGRLIACDACLVRLLEDDQLAVRASHGLAPSTGAPPVEGGLEAEVLRGSAPLLVNELDPGDARLGLADPLGGQTRAYLAVPLEVEGRALGTLSFYSREPFTFTPVDRDLAALFGRLGAAVLWGAELLDAARTANRLKSEFLATMSHELRTPLNSIIGHAQLMLTDERAPVSEPHRAQLERVLRSAHHLLGLISDLLDLAKIEAGRATVDLMSFDPLEPVRVALETVAPLAAEHGLPVILEDAQAPALVISDEARVRQIALNLLSNAVKFTPAGEVRARVQAAPGGHWQVEVSDTGIGVPPEHLASIFEEFRQVDGSATRVAGGTGLGLAIARRAARLLGGDLTVRSTVGQGSTFTLTLPVDARPRPVEDSAAVGARPGPPERTPA